MKLTLSVFANDPVELREAIWCLIRQLDAITGKEHVLTKKEAEE